MPTTESFSHISIRSEDWEVDRYLVAQVSVPLVTCSRRKYLGPAVVDTGTLCNLIKEEVLDRYPALKRKLTTAPPEALPIEGMTANVSQRIRFTFIIQGRAHESFEAVFWVLPREYDIEPDILLCLNTAEEAGLITITGRTFAGP